MLVCRILNGAEIQSIRGDIMQIGRSNKHLLAFSDTNIQHYART